MSYYFPNEILTEILKRLPVKVLMRLRRVEKSWYSLVQSQTFITIHSNQPKNTPRDKFILFAGSFYKVLSIRCNQKEECEKYRLPYVLRNFTWHAVSNGLVCLSTMSLRFNDEIYYYGSTHIWNPAVHKYITLPHPPPRSPGPHLSTVTPMNLAFGFVPKYKDYKIVKFISDFHHVFIEVYTLSTNSWKVISPYNLPRPIFVAGNRKEAFINGAAFWIADTAENGNIMVCFNTQNDVMLEISLPLPVSSEKYANLSLGSFGDQSLALFVMTQGFIIDMWVSEELDDDIYHKVSWKTKRFTIDGGCLDFQVLGLIGNTCVILRNLLNEFELDLYDLQNKQTTHSVSANLRCILGFYISRMVTLIPFTESLVLLNSVIDSNMDLPNL